MKYISQILSEKHGVYGARPGAKVDCPWCTHRTLSINRDDTLAKCFHPGCGRFFIAGQEGKQHNHIFYEVLAQIYSDLRVNLLELRDKPGQNAYTYLLDERKIHPRVIEDSMLGAIPSGGYYLEEIFQPAIEKAQAAAEQEQSALKKDKGNKSPTPSAKGTLDLLMEAKEKLYKCISGHAGWLAFFYTDAFHRIVAIRFRRPYSKDIVYFKPLKHAGLFGHGLFSPYPFKDWKVFNDHLIVTEGEFNQLQLQSLSLQVGESCGENPEYVNACAVGGVTNADHEAIKKLYAAPIFWYDNDLAKAGFALVEKAQESMSVEGFTAPIPDSDPDSFIRSFGLDHRAAWDAVKALIASRKRFPRIYSETGAEFFRGQTFIPKRLAEAIMESDSFKYTDEMLWRYQGGVYRPEGEKCVKSEAQRLLGEERLEKRITETLRYIETAVATKHQAPNSHYINLRNGRLSIATGKVEPHTPDNFEVAQIPVDYEPTAICPHFDNYLITTLDPEIIPLAEEILGYCLIPSTIYEKAVMLLGEGSNGKSVFLHVAISLFGKENVSTEALHDLEENRFRVAGLYGKLANICADLDCRALKSSQMFKKIVSGDPITGEWKFKNPFSFSPFARLLFSANRLPATTDVTYAFYRRWLIIPFTRTFEGDNADKELREKLITELPGIFNRALAGLMRLLSQNKFSEPDAVIAALGEYLEENNSLIPFISECIKPGGYVAKKTFYQSYVKWCLDQGSDPVNQKEIKATVIRNFPKVRERRLDGGNGPWVWDGISLMDNAPAFERPND